MTAQIRFRDTAGTLRTAARVRARDEAGNLRTINRIRMRDASGILRTVWQALASTISPTTLSQTGTTSQITTSGSATCTPAGTAPFTYLWGSDLTDDIIPLTPTAATTVFRHSAMLSGDSYGADFYCDVTDATGFAVRSSNTVRVTIARS